MKQAPPNHHQFQVKAFLFLLLMSTFVVSVLPHTIYAEWTNSHEPSAISSKARSFAVNGSNIFVGTQGKGVLHSTDNGARFSYANTGLPEVITVYSLLVNDDTLFAGTDSGIYRSANNGKNWTPVSKGLTQKTPVRSLLIRGNKLFAGLERHGIFTSLINETLWTPAYQSNVTVTSFIALADTIIAGTDRGFLHSTDNGNTWKHLTNSALNNANISSLAQSDQTLISMSGGKGIYKSTNNGSYWGAINDGFPADANVASIVISRGLIFVATDKKGVFLSTNDGTSWRPLNKGIAKLSTTIIGISDNAAIIGLATGGIQRMMLSEIVPLKKLSVSQSYSCPKNYFHFTLDKLKNVAWYDLYCNNVRFCHANTTTLFSKLVYGPIEDSVQKVTGTRLKEGKTITFHAVCRSNNNEIIGISNIASIKFQLAIGTQHQKAIPINSGIHMSGRLIDCSFQKDPVRISLYSLNGAVAWVSRVTSETVMIPAQLPCGLYTLETHSSTDKKRSTIVLR